MEFIKNSFPNNPSSNLLMNESTAPLNHSMTSTPNGKNKIINPNYITANSSTINQFYTNDPSSLLLNGMESHSKPNTLIDSPLLELTIPQHLNKINNNNNTTTKDIYKLSPSDSVSSIADANGALTTTSLTTTTTTTTGTSQIPTTIHSSISMSLSLTSPALSNDNIHELLSTHSNSNTKGISLTPSSKPQFPYTPSSSLSFASSSEFDPNSTKLEGDIDLSTYLSTITEEESPKEDGKPPPPSKLINNIYNMEIYNPSIPSFNDYTIKTNQDEVGVEEEVEEDVKDVDVEKNNNNSMDSPKGNFLFLFLIYLKKFLFYFKDN